MRRSSWKRSLVDKVVLLFPLVFLALFWILRTVQFPRYHRIVGEDGALEDFQFLFYLLSGVLCLWIAGRFFKRKARARGILFLILLVGFLFLSLEEISWGQRVFSRSSPDYFLEYNIQSETNIHNLTMFQPFLHFAYLTVGTILAALCLLPGSSLRKRFWYLIPERSLILYFLPLVFFYAWFEFRRLAQGTLIYAYDQELTELLLSLGLLLFLIRVSMGQRKPLNG